MSQDTNDVRRPSTKATIVFLVSLVALVLVCSVLLFGDEEEPAVSAPDKAATSVENTRQCLRSTACIDKNWGVDAQVYCEYAIEALAKYDMRWTDGFAESKFPRIRLVGPEHRTATFSGSKAQFQNGFGAYQNVSYWCEYDPLNERVVDAEVEAK